MSSFSIRKAQTDALCAMLNLNQVETKGQSAWKVLIYDDFCRDIISPLLNIGQLREQGVTLHLALHAKRLPVEDVPAIYFIAPTEENVERLCKDLKDALYDQYHVNFAGTTPRALLERLADSALESDRVSLITKVYDQFLGFQALAPSLFTLALPNSYYAFNDPRVSDAQAQANIERCVDGLFAALAVSGVVPIIRCPRNGAAEMVARALSLRLNEHVAARAGSSLASATALSSFRRPLLVVLERGVDLASMMHHPWTYSAMVHDVLGLRLNRVRLPRDDDDAAAAAAAIAANATSTHEPKDGDKAAERVFDLDARDTFWAANSGATFQQVAVEVKQQVADYKQRIARLDALRGTPEGAAEGLVATSSSTSSPVDATGELGGFVSEIPELQAKKGLIETHTNIATSLLKHIKRRELDRFYALEEALLARGNCDRAELRHMLTTNVGLTSDRVRLLLVYYLCVAERAAAGSAVAIEFAKFEQTLADAGADLAALHYVRQARAHLGAMSIGAPNAATSSTSADGDQSSGDGSSDSASWLALHKGYESLSSFTNLFAGSVDRLKALLPREQELPVTRIVRALMDHRAMKGVDQYLYFDPNVDGGRGGPVPGALAVALFHRSRSLSSSSTSGICAIQHRLCAAAPTKTIVYGTTELLTAEQMLDQMKRLNAAEKK